MLFTSPLPGPNQLQNLPQNGRFQTCFGLKLLAKGGLNNLIFSICFQMLKIYYFEMALNTCEMRFNDIKIAFFSKKIQKTAQRLGASSPDPRL